MTALTIILTLIYVTGCLIVTFFADMINEFNKANLPADEYYDLDTAMVCIIALGSWVAVYYVWAYHETEIRWAWKFIIKNNKK